MHRTGLTIPWGLGTQQVSRRKKKVLFFFSDHFGLRILFIQKNTFAKKRYDSSVARAQGYGRGVTFFFWQSLASDPSPPPPPCSLETRAVEVRGMDPQKGIGSYAAPKKIKNGLHNIYIYIPVRYRVTRALWRKPPWRKRGGVWYCNYDATIHP